LFTKQLSDGRVCYDRDPAGIKSFGNQPPGFGQEVPANQDVVTPVG